MENSIAIHFQIWLVYITRLVSVALSMLIVVKTIHFVKFGFYKKRRRGDVPVSVMECVTGIYWFWLSIILLYDTMNNGVRYMLTTLSDDYVRMGVIMLMSTVLLDAVYRGYREMKRME